MGCNLWPRRPDHPLVYFKPTGRLHWTPMLSGLQIAYHVNQNVNIAHMHSNVTYSQVLTFTREVMGLAMHAGINRSEIQQQAHGVDGIISIHPRWCTSLK